MTSKRIVLLTGLEFAYLRRFMHSFESEKIRFPGKCFLKKFSESDYNEFPELQNLNSEKVYILHGDEEKLPLCHSIIQRWKKEYTRPGADVTQYVSPDYTNIAYIDGKLIRVYHKQASQSKLKSLENKWKRR